MPDNIHLYSLAPFDRSSRVAWYLAERGWDFDRTFLNAAKGEHKSAKYAALNPFGKVPTLEIDGTTLFESGAIISYLSETYPDDKIAPTPGSERRAEFLQWLFWASSTLDGAMTGVLVSGRGWRDRRQRKAAIKRAEDQLRSLDQHLKSNEFLLGTEFTAADIVAGHCVTTLSGQMSYKKFKQVQAYQDRLSKRPRAAVYFDAITN